VAEIRLVVQEEGDHSGSPAVVKARGVRANVALPLGPEKDYILSVFSVLYNQDFKRGVSYSKIKV
jgi:hypothetical protein